MRRPAIALTFLLASLAQRAAADPPPSSVERIATLTAQLDRYTERVASHGRSLRISGIAFVASGIFDATLSALGIAFARDNTVGKLAAANSIVAAFELSLGIPLWVMGARYLAESERLRAQISIAPTAGGAALGFGVRY